MSRLLLRLLPLVGGLMLVWLTVLPTALGGSTSYVTTHGISMAPRFSTGDLALVRPKEPYEVGDVVAYHSVQLDTVVLHRIVDAEDGRFTLKGDNNDFLDAEQPTSDQMIGRLYLRIPQGGVWLDRVASPLSLGVATFALLGLGGGTAHRHRRRKQGTVSKHARRAPHGRWVRSLPPWARLAGAGFAVAGLLGLVVAVPAWTTPTTALDPVEHRSTQSMRFSYRTEVPRSPAYDSTVVRSPDPVFRKLADTVQVTYAYHGRPGSIRLLARLSTPGGWRSTVPLGSAVDVVGEEHTGTTTLDLRALEARATRASAVTGIPSTQVDLAVVARIAAVDQPVFEPALALTLTPLQLSLAGDPASLQVLDEAVSETMDATPRAFGVAGRQLPVSAARVVSLILLGLAVLGALVLAAVGRVGAPAGEGAGIRRRYAPILVEVEPLATPPGRPTVDVVRFTTLAKLADRYGLLVLHWSRSGVDTFVVQDQGTTYRYRASTGSSGTPAGEGLPPDSDSDAGLPLCPQERPRRPAGARGRRARPRA